VSVSAADIAFSCSLFENIPDFNTRRMFGALGLYCGPTIFAVQREDGQIMIKAAKGPFADKMRDLGGEQWLYTRKDGSKSSMPYWTLPDVYLDDPDESCALAREALQALEA